jgi:hypothetical protein
MCTDFLIFDFKYSDKSGAVDFNRASRLKFGHSATNRDTFSGLRTKPVP